MKYILDVDDTMFETVKFKQAMFKSIEVSVDIPLSKIEEEYSKFPKPFSLKKFISHVRDLVKEKVIGTDKLYEEIMSSCRFFKNSRLTDAVKRLGRENCYIVTEGDPEFQLDKINRSGIGELFLPDHIFVTGESKVARISEICEKHKDEDVVFIDNKTRHFNEINREKHPNLTTMPYLGDSSAELFKRFVPKGPETPSELKKVS